ncbi:MAG: hypothetical protein KDD02_13520 [Phaeodactylibacter sp.]|nr:hypothetical protein [Phaeodactylibacter sp.]
MKFNTINRVSGVITQFYPILPTTAQLFDLFLLCTVLQNNLKKECSMKTQLILGFMVLGLWVYAEGWGSRMADPFPVQESIAGQLTIPNNLIAGWDTVIPGFDPLPPRIPLSSKLYYPDRSVPSTIDGYSISGGRFDEFDLVNIVYHSNSVRDSLGNLIRGDIGKIDFFDMNNQLQGSFDILTNNPYKPEQYSKFLAEGYMDVGHSVVDRRSAPDYDWRKDVKQYATWTDTYENPYCGTLCVAYYLQALDQELTLLGVVATFVLLDERGNEIARFEDVEDVFLGEGLVTCDGKYFCLRYGGAFTEEFGRMYNDHLRIYDIATREIIFERELPFDWSMEQPTEIPGNFVQVNEMLYDYVNFKKENNIPERMLSIYDIENRVRYYTPYIAEEHTLPMVTKFTENGYLTQNINSGEIKVVNYKEDWQSERF